MRVLSPSPSEYHAVPARNAATAAAATTAGTPWRSRRTIVAEPVIPVPSGIPATPPTSVPAVIASVAAANAIGRSSAPSVHQSPRTGRIHAAIDPPTSAARTAGRRSSVPAGTGAIVWTDRASATHAANATPAQIGLPRERSRKKRSVVASVTRSAAQTNVTTRPAPGACALSSRPRTSSPT